MRKLGQGRLWRSVPKSRPSIKVNLKISLKLGIDRSFKVDKNLKMDRNFKMDSSCRVALRYRNAGNAMFSRSRLRDALRLYTQAFFISREMQNNNNGWKERETNPICSGVCLIFQENSLNCVILQAVLWAPTNSKELAMAFANRCFDEKRIPN